MGLRRDGAAAVELEDDMMARGRCAVEENGSGYHVKMREAYTSAGTRCVLYIGKGLQG